MSEREEVLLEPGFVLHHRPFSNSSQLIDCLTRNFGRVGLIAHGSRRAGRGQRALLQPFSALRLSWVRRRDLGRLTGVEADTTITPMNGDRLLAGFYVNELVLRLVARGDPNDDVFSCYSACLSELAGRASTSLTLRLFELSFLRALGYGLDLDRDADTGEPLQAERRYVLELDNGLKAADDSVPDAAVYRGRELIALGRRELSDVECLRSAKRLLGTVLNQHLGERPLKSRSVFRDIVDRGLER